MTDKKPHGLLTGRKDRQRRLNEPRKGASASSHVDFLVLACRLLESSTEHASQLNNNVSPYVLAGIPILIAMLRALLIDCEILSMKAKPDLECLKKDGDIRTILERFDISGDLRRDAEFLVEIRNEIIHPTHISIGSADNWPDYLRFIKDQGLLNTTGKMESDYDFFHQLNSHRLFQWSFKVSREIAQIILLKYKEETGFPLFEGFLSNFDSFEI